MTCLSDSELLLRAIDLDASGASAQDQHLSQCASCRDRSTDLREIIGRLESGVTPTADDRSHCLDELGLARLASGTAPNDGGSRIEHLASCGRCRAQFAELVRLLALPEVTGELDRIERRQAPRTGWIWRVAGMGVAAAVIGLVTLRPTIIERREPEPHRAPTITGTASPEIISPSGQLDQAPVLRWRTVGGADRYRVTLYDATGLVLFEVESTDTTVVIPDSLGLRPARPYLWKVEARSRFDRWASSKLTEFTVAGPEPR